MVAWLEANWVSMSLQMVHLYPASGVSDKISSKRSQRGTSGDLNIWLRKENITSPKSMAQKTEKRPIIIPQSKRGFLARRSFDTGPDASFCRACRIKDFEMIHLRILTYLSSNGVMLWRRMAFWKVPQTMDSVSAKCPTNFCINDGGEAGSNFESRLVNFVYRQFVRRFCCLS